MEDTPRTPLSPAARLFSEYRAILALSQSMRTCAEHDEWASVTSQNQERMSRIKQLAALGGVTDRQEQEQVALIADTIREILECERVVRELAEAKMGHLAPLLQAFSDSVRKEDKTAESESS